MMIMTVIIPMESEYVSELQPPTGVLFITQVICEHGERMCNDIYKEYS
jgi:hypothetical protein